MVEVALRRWLLQVARELGRSYFTLEEVSAVALWGSLATGDFDDCSDIDLIVFRSKKPSEAQLESDCIKLGLENVAREPSLDCDGWDEGYYWRGISVNVKSVSEGNWKSIVSSVLEAHSIDPRAHNLLASFLFHVPYHGAPQLHQWLAELRRPIPIEVAKILVEKYLDTRPIWEIDRNKNRPSEFAFVGKLTTDAIFNLCGVLAGINRTFHYSRTKRIGHFLERLSISPSNCCSRLQALSIEPRIETKHHLLREIWKEALELVESSSLNVQTLSARKYLADYEPWTSRADDWV